MRHTQFSHTHFGHTHFGRFSRLAGVAAGLGLSLLGASSATAQPGASGMPDLSDFAGAIAKSAEAPPPKAAGKPGLFKSGLVVPRVKPGAGARGVGRQLREAAEKAGGPQPALAQLEAAMPQILTALEDAFEKNGFARRDMGVAFSYVLLDLYETANKTSIPAKPSAVAMRTLATALARHWGPKFRALSPAAKEQMYESMLVFTTFNTLMAGQFDKAGKQQEAATMRETAAKLFEQLTGVPAAQVKIAPDGRLSGFSAAPQQ